MWPAVHKSIAWQTVRQTELEQKQLQQKGAARNINKFIKKVSKKAESAQTNGSQQMQRFTWTLQKGNKNSRFLCKLHSFLSFPPPPLPPAWFNSMHTYKKHREKYWNDAAHLCMTTKWQWNRLCRRKCRAWRVEVIIPCNLKNTTY